MAVLYAGCVATEQASSLFKAPWLKSLDSGSSRSLWPTSINEIVELVMAQAQRRFRRSAAEEQLAGRFMPFDSRQLL